MTVKSTIIDVYDRAASLAAFFSRADDAVDELEEVASLAELVARRFPPPSAKLPRIDINTIVDSDE